MAAKNAIEWHTQIARNFDQKYSTSRNFTERYAIWTNVIDKYSNLSLSVLDIGCGSGVFTFYSAEKNNKVIGIDASKEMLRICQEKMEKTGTKNVQFLNCNIESLGKNLDQKADMVICSSVLEYIEDLDSSLDLIKQIMNRDGLFLFSLPNKQSIYRKIEALTFQCIGRPKYYRYVRNVCTLKDMESKLKRLNFSIVESQYYGETPILSWLFRVFGKSQYSDNLFIIVARLIPSL
ncbi:MAG: class I SAM-dependent methyltransferase [Saprospiraceae bacterium]|nr:class I SAM-dependent methyltransferase [Candidatus Vicinibacter proximus]MBL7823720.1 class I SAM-dependent methyltransferase [Saprospiraceae bacterium]HRG32889.1 class I SAM-dependent methyltransferase [Saprospiraceae bacterium]